LVALRRPADLGPPPEDGLPVRSVAHHQPQKGYYMCGYTQSAATATKDKFDARTYVEPFAACGVCVERETGTRSWGSAAVAVQIDNPFDLYVLNDIDPVAAQALATRIREIGVPRASVHEITLTDEGAYAHAVALGRTMSLGARIVVTTGDANALPLFVRALQPDVRWRYTFAVIDPHSAMFAWDSLMALCMDERAFDVLSLFPDRIDLARGMSYYLKNPSGAKLDAYFGTTAWRDIVRANPMHCEHALLRLYERQTEKLLDMKIGKPKGVGPTRRALLYHLIFASKSQFGIDLWNKVNAREWDGQDELYFPGL
jgi:three-Cys-motif partner protein